MKSRVGNWMSTSVTIAKSAAAAGEVDVRGFLPLVIHVKGPWTAANIGFRARAYNQSTSRVVYDNTGASNPLQISGINTTVGGCYAIPVSPGLGGICFLTVYSKNATAATTAVVNQNATTTLYIEGIG